MAVLDFLSRKALVPAWTYRTNGVIWRLIPSESGLFVGEERDLESKEACFFCLNQQSGKVLWQRRTFNERWWIGVEAVHGDHAFLHGFMKPDMPQHKGIIAVDLLTGRVAWSNSDVGFILAVDDSVFASGYSADGSRLHELDCRTGETLHTWDDETDVLNSARARVRARVTDELEFPLPLGTSSVLDEHASNLAYKYSRMENIAGAIEVLQKHDLLFLSYHVREGNGVSEVPLRNILNVIHLKDGEVVLTETLNSNAPAVAPDSFFLHQDMLYFIKDRSVLTAVNIHELTSEDKRSR